MSERADGQVTFMEIGGKDAGATQRFFSAVFGWPCHDEAWFETPNGKVGTHGDDPTPQIYVYFNVADLAAAADRVRTAGGEADPIAEEPGFGRFVNCRGPGGVQFGLHQAE